MIDALMDAVVLLDKKDEDIKELCNTIIDTSLFWTGEDEHTNPGLKKMRTLAGYHVRAGGD